MDYNLMPWRQREQQLQRRKAYFLVVLSLMMTGAIGVGLHLYMSRKIQNINANIAGKQLFLANHAAESKPEKSQHLALPKLIHALNQVNVYGICIASIAMQGGSLQLVGYANQIAGLLAFMTYLQTHVKLPTLQIEQVKKDSKKNLITFHLTASY